jgi:hypothetical protein
MSQQPTQELIRRLRRIAEQEGLAKNRLQHEPGTVFEVVTRQMVENLTRELQDLRRRIDALTLVIVSTVLGDIISRLL